ncbi:hypothetical protein AXF42_Ash011927 [Apostasia shenzhenica]|uniref:Uncharacterized protein n=1 Tax=Apostasia shenzhenica TaxID=1088818 RepID=A0A2I0AW83_9ASPA|nr:hypothetical protein AXF42_Ash011927 [Apostasia shenzhenica]
MEDLEEAVRREVNIVSASPVGHHVKNQAAFDVLLQTLVDVNILDQENIRSPAVLPFCGPKGPDKFFDAGSHCPEEVPPAREAKGAEMAKELGYAIFKEVVPPPGTVLMKRARRGKPPTTQLSKEVTEEVPKKKRGPSESTSPKPPSKKAKSVEEEGLAAGGEHDWQQSIEPLYSTNFAGIFGDEGTRMAVRTKGDERRLTVVSLPPANQGDIYRGEVGLALGSGLVSKGLEEKLERTSTPELYSGFANRVATTDNKALRDKMDKVAGDKETVAAERSAAVVKAYKTSLPFRKERLDGIKRAWEGLASILIQGGKITASDLREVDPFSCLAADPIYREEGFDLTDDLIHQMFDLLNGISEG